MYLKTTSLKKVCLVLFFVAFYADSKESIPALIISDAGYFYLGNKIDSLKVFPGSPEVNLMACPCADTELVSKAVNFLSNGDIEITLSHIFPGEYGFELCSCFTEPTY